MIALYARVSTDMQETGLASQLAAARRHAKEKYPTEPTVEFLDDGYTGANLERPRLEELRSQVRAGRIRVVLAYDPDRLSRNVVDLLVLVNELEKGGATIDFVNGGFDQTPTGRLLLQMRGVIAEFERTQIRARTQRGRMEAARNGRIAGGRRTFGYDQEKGKGVLTVNESQAAIVRRVFSMVLEGRSMRAIVRQLNAEGVLPQRGNIWQKSSLSRILGNVTYTGCASYNRRRRDKDGRISFRPESEWIPLTVPAIVDRETFEQVQAQLRRNSSLLSGNRDRLYLLTGLLRCACGFRICGCASHAKRFYRCTGRDPLQGKRCRGRWLNADVMEETIKASVLEVLRGGLIQRKVAEHAPKLQAVDYAAEIAKAEKEIRTHQGAEERAVRFMVAPEHASSQAVFERELARATEQRMTAEGRKATLEKARAAEAQLKAGAAGLREMSMRAVRALSRLTPEQWQRVLRLLLDEVTVTGNTLELRGILPTDPAAFRPESEDVMAARRRDFQSPLGSGLAAHVAEVERQRVGDRRSVVLAHVRRELLRMVQERDHFAQMPHAKDAQIVGDGGLGSVVGRHQQVGDLLAAGAGRDRESSAHRPDGTVK
jgi:site-specific DNA recombinase